MPSPFPGMNPYLEQDDAWQDFHQSFIPLMREALMRQVLPNYIVKVEEHLFIHELPGEERHLLGRADVSIASAPFSGRVAGQAIAEPVVAELPTAVDVERQSYLEIRDRENRELVTVLELLSPTNKKSGPDCEQYLAKRRRLVRSPVHLVEIDLLRGGPRLPFVGGPPECAYYAMVSRAEAQPSVQLWPIGLRDPLPVVPVPLRAADPDAQLDLQPLLHRLYDAAGYEAFVYSGTPEPALAGEDAAWAAQFLPARWSRRAAP